VLERSIEIFTAGDVLARSCVAILTVLFFGLSLAVTVTRMRTGMWHGVPDEPTSFLAKVVRTHGNTSEYVALLSLLILATSAAPRPAWVAALAVLAVLARLLFAYAMLTCTSLARFDPVRAAAVGATYVSGFGLGLALLVV
jgi:uncharacterized membrane protein YecN with MAPEG domain